MGVVDVHVKKGLIFCYRSACVHPFVVGIGFFLFFLYRFFPSLFAFLVSSSPVIFCTAVLLGALLSFGNSNFPEVEEEEKDDDDDEKTNKSFHEISALKTGVVEGDVVVEKDGSVSVETHAEKEVESTKEDGCISDSSPLIDEETKAKAFNVEERGLEDEEEGGEKKEIEDHQVENSRPERDLPAGTYLEDPFGVSQWKKIKDHDESSDLDSDGGESSSPDASMADILPMLDELHPLLDSEYSQPVLVSHADLDDASESNDGSSSESEEEEVEERVQNQEEDDEEEAQPGGQDDGTKPVVTWTEDDEKNLMDLGNSELERNRRLESLIARRRARKNLRTMVAEKNLIDFDSSDLPFPIAPISTARRNPFDLHYDSNEGMGLPPIPGSAPSVMVPRQNPFDLPYGPLEERPNLSGGSFEEEFLTGHEKDMYFRRYESFHMGSSFFGESKQEFQFRPYFTSEEASPERMGYPTFQRQMSEISDSKMSSATEADSVSSIVDQDNQKNLIEGELSEEGKQIHHTDNAPNDNKPLGVDVGDIDNQRDSKADDENVHERELTLAGTESTANVYKNPEVVKEKHSGLSFLSLEEEKIFQERTRCEPVDDSENSTQPSVLDSDPRDTAGEGMDDSHKKEPVYDWNSSEVEKTLSGITIIEEALCYADKGVLTSISSIASDIHVDGESSIHRGNIEKETTTSNEGTWVASSQLCAVEENEMRSTELTPISEEDVIQAGLSGDIQSSDMVIDPMVPSVVEAILPNSDSFSSDAESEDERRSEEHLHHEQDQILSSTSIPFHDGPPQFDMDDADADVSDSGVFSEDLTHLVSEKPPTSSDGHNEESQEVSSFSELSIKGTNSADNSQEVIIHDHEDNDSSVPSLLVSDPSSILAEVSENNPSTDRIVSEDNFHDRIHNSVISHDTTGIHDGQFDSVVEIKEIDEGLLTELDAVGDFCVKESGRNTNQMEKQLVVGMQESLPEVQVIEPNSTQEIEYESYKLIESEALVNPQKPLESGVNSSSIELLESSSELQILEASSTADFDSIFIFDQTHKKVEESSVFENHKPLLEETEDGNAQSQPLNQDPVQVMINVELPVLAERSLDDTDSTLDEPCEGESADSITLETTHSKPVLEETDTDSVEFELPNPVPNLTQTNSELPVLEARSLEEFDSGFKLFCQEESSKPTSLESIENEQSVLEETEAGSVEFEMPNQDSNSIDVTLQLPVEAISLEDTDSPLKQFHKDEVQQPIILDSIHEDSILEENISGSAEFKVPKQDSNPIETNFEHPVLDARSVEDTESALRKVSEEDLEKSIVLELIQEDSMLEEIKVRSIKLEVPGQYSNTAKINLEVPVHEARSLKDSNSAFKFQEEKVKKPGVIESVHEDSTLEETKDGFGEIEVPSQDPNPTEASLEAPIPQARSLQYMDSASEQFHLEELNEPVVLESVNDKLTGEEARAEPAELKTPSQDPNPTETNLELHDVKGEDIYPSPMQICDEEVEKPVVQQTCEAPILKGTEVQSAVLMSQDEGANPSEVDMELPATEPRSLEQFDLCKQLHGGQKPSLDESSATGHLEKPTLHEPVKEDHHENPIPHESVTSQSSMEVHTDSQAPEARSAGDAHLDLEQLLVLEDKREDLPKPAESEDVPTELLAEELKSEGELNVDIKDLVTQEANVESELVMRETDEASSSSKTDENKNKKSGKSNSSSSSSSSDSD